MNSGQRIWRAIVEPVLHWISILVEKHQLHRSLGTTIVRGYGRDSVRYYENGRWVTVEAYLMFGRSDIDRVIHRGCSLRWNDSGEPLSPDERARVFQSVAKHFEGSGVMWKFNI